MTFYEFVAGIIEVALAQTEYPEAFMVMEIEHAHGYSKESKAWSVHINHVEPQEEYSVRFRDRVKKSPSGRWIVDSPVTARAVSVQSECYFTVLYDTEDGLFYLDDL